MAERSTVLNANLFQSEANGLQMAIDQYLLNNVNTLLTGIIEVVNSDGTYDIQPTLNYLLRNQSPLKATILINIPAAVIRFGNAGIKGTYQVGDAVLVGIVSRDISILKKAWKVLTNPASLRRFAVLDGIILGGLSNTAPTAFVELTNSAITVTAPTVNINGTLNINGAPYAAHKHVAGTYAAGGDSVTGQSGSVV